MAMRSFLIFYPLLDAYETQTVNVEDGEFPEDAIIREGSAVDEWRLYREMPLQD